MQLLNEHSDHEVHLYEAADRPGGHANTVTYNPPKGKPVDVDTYVTTSSFLATLHLIEEQRIRTPYIT